jgi:hypothetical protein
MAADQDSILKLLREELRAAGYGGLVQEDELASDGRSRDAAQALDELLSRLQTGVLPAMLAHAASIRNMTLRPGPRGPLWEPIPSRPNVLAVGVDSADHDISIRLNTDDASQIEAHARELERLLNEMRSTGANEG